MATISMAPEKLGKYTETAAFDFPLYGRGKEKTTQMDGKLKLKIWHTKDMEMV